MEFRNGEPGLEIVELEQGAVDAQAALGRAGERIGLCGAGRLDPIAEAGKIDLGEINSGAAGIVAFQAPLAGAADFGVGDVGLEARAGHGTFGGDGEVGIAERKIGDLQAMAGEIGVEGGEAIDGVALGIG